LDLNVSYEKKKRDVVVAKSIYDMNQ